MVCGVEQTKKKLIRRSFEQRKYKALRIVLDHFLKTAGLEQCSGEVLTISLQLPRTGMSLSIRIRHQMVAIYVATRTRFRRK